MTAWDGQERRQDDHSVRIALLEKCAKDAEARHEENKKSLVSIHVRISDMKEDFRQELSKGIDAIVDKLDAQNKMYEQRAERITRVEAALIWFERSLYGLGAFGITVAGWIFHHEHTAKVVK